jgi:hypothetical protein
MDSGSYLLICKQRPRERSPSTVPRIRPEEEILPLFEVSAGYRPRDLGEWGETNALKR